MNRKVALLALVLQLFCQNSVALYKTSENYLPIVRVFPIYPEEARSAQIEGSCTVRFNIDLAGFVKDKKEITCSPAGYFEETVSRGISAFRYNSLMFEGVEMEIVGMVEKFWFSLKENTKTSYLEPGTIYNRLINCSAETKQCVASQLPISNPE